MFRRLVVAHHSLAADNNVVMPPVPSPDAAEVLDRLFLDMRGKLLSLVADLDRIQRAPRGAEIVRDDPRLAQLREAARLLEATDGNRAEQLQLIFSDRSEAPR